MPPIAMRPTRSILLALGVVGLAATSWAQSQPRELVCSLQNIGNGRVRFELANLGPSVIGIYADVLPLDDYGSDAFEVTVGRERVDYAEGHAHRGHPWVYIAPRSSLESVYDVTRGYSVGEGGPARIRLRVNPWPIKTADGSRAAIDHACNELFVVLPPSSVSPVPNAPARAQHAITSNGITSTGCSDDQVAAILVAIDFTNRALNRIEMLSLASTDNPLYYNWFGDFDAGRAAVVEDVFDHVRGVLNDMQFRCDWSGCPSSAYAWAGGPSCGFGTMCLCNQFWRSRPAVSSPILPAGWHPLIGFAEAPCSTSADCPIGQACSFPPPGFSGKSCTNNDSQVVTLAHEMSHFYGTRDWEYGRSSCGTLAANDPNKAITNGDTYGYFVEDVLLGPEMASYLIALY